MTREEKNKLIKLMIQSRMEEMEEVEKGIVIATMKLEAMSGPNMDLRLSSVFRKRRDELEEEYIKLKNELSTLNAGELPEQKKKNAVEKARDNLRAVEAIAKERREKLGDGIDDFNDKLGPLKG
jgi:hypothetical protein